MQWPVSTGCSVFSDCLENYIFFYTDAVCILYVLFIKASFGVTDHWVPKSFTEASRYTLGLGSPAKETLNSVTLLIKCGL